MLVNVKITITFDTNSSTISVTDFVRNFSIHLTFFLDVTPNILNIWRQMNVVLQCEDDTRGGGGGGSSVHLLTKAA